MLFREEKSSFKKVQKHRHFPKGLVHGFWPKMAIFLIGRFWANSASKDRFFIFRIENNAF